MFRSSLFYSLMTCGKKVFEVFSSKRKQMESVGVSVRISNLGSRLIICDGFPVEKKIIEQTKSPHTSCWRYSNSNS